MAGTHFTAGASVTASEVGSATGATQQPHTGAPAGAQQQLFFAAHGADEAGGGAETVSVACGWAGRAAGIGAPTEGDVLLASTAEAQILCFNVTPSAAVTKVAENKGIDIKAYRIIYEMIDEVDRLIQALDEALQTPP